MTQPLDERALVAAAEAIVRESLRRTGNADRADELISAMSPAMRSSFDAEARAAIQAYLAALTASQAQPGVSFDTAVGLSDNLARYPDAALLPAKAAEPVACCQDCGRPAPVWFAPNALWNRVMGGPEATDDPGGMLCPCCFIARAERTVIVPTAWVLDIEGPLTDATPPSSPVMGVGEGFVLVPVEPTDAMIEAGKDSLFEHARFVAIDRDPLFCWRAMVHAAASPAQAKEGKDG